MGNRKSKNILYAKMRDIKRVEDETTQSDDAIEAIIGARTELTPVTRTTGQLSTSDSLFKSLEVIDGGIGFDAQLSGQKHVISTALTIYQNLDALDQSLKNLYANTTQKTIAATGNNQGNATGIVTGFVFVTGADDVRGVILPLVVIGKTVQIFNLDTTAGATKKLKIYPATGEYINAGAVNVGVNINHTSGGIVSSVICTYAYEGHWTVTAMVGTIS